MQRVGGCVPCVGGWQLSPCRYLAALIFPHTVHTPVTVLSPHTSTSVLLSPTSTSLTSTNASACMLQVPAPYVFVALIPAIIITLLFWFDHGVSSLMAQQSKFGVKR